MQRSDSGTLLARWLFSGYYPQGSRKVVKTKRLKVPLFSQPFASAHSNRVRRPFCCIIGNYVTPSSLELPRRFAGAVGTSGKKTVDHLITSSQLPIGASPSAPLADSGRPWVHWPVMNRSEEHTSEL